MVRAKPEPCLGRDILKKIGLHLAAYYDGQLRYEPTPRMAELIEQLPKAEEQS